MKRLTAIVGLTAAIVVAFALFRPSRPKALPPTPEPEATATYRTNEALVPLGSVSGKAPATNWLSRLAKGELVPPLRPEQLEAYLAANHRGVDSLLGAYRTTRDPALLQEATEKYAKDPRVALEASYFASPEDRRKWLEALKASAPDNALANYLSAGDYFKAGDKTAALEELQAAAIKSDFQDYFGDFVQNATEAYRAAGYSEAEAKTMAAGMALMPYLASLKQVGGNLVDLAESYRQGGDESSAQAALDMAVALGARLNQSEAPTLIGMLVGIAVEKKALGAFDPATPYGTGGDTVQGVLATLDQQREGLKALSQLLTADLVSQLPDTDLISFRERQLLFGAQPAMEWLLNKYRPAGASGPSH